MGHASLLGYTRDQNQVRMPTHIKVIVVALVAGGLGIFVALAFIGGGGGGCTLPDGIEEILPDCNTSVLGQTQVGVRVSNGYRAELSLNGEPIPLDQVTSGGQIATDASGQQNNPAGAAQTQYFFLPPPDGELALQPQNTMTVRFWPISQGETAARTYSWLFEAA
jgi:hypothetical protein